MLPSPTAMADKGAGEVLQSRTRQNTDPDLTLRPSFSVAASLLIHAETLSSKIFGDYSRPAKRTIYLALAGFALFLILGSLATRFPTQGMRLVFAAVSSVLLFCLAAASSLDLATRSRLSGLMRSLRGIDMG